MLNIRLLGEFLVERDGAPVALPRSRKTLALLAYLAVTGRRQTREHLCRLLWELPADPRAALRWSLSKIRGIVDEPNHTRLVSDRAGVQLDVRDVHIDLISLRAACRGDLATLETETLRMLSTAMSGDFLEGIELADCQEFQAWCTAHRSELADLKARVDKALADRARKDHAAATDKPSIAVLPFDNLSDDPRQAYLADGLTEEITTGLAQFGLFSVASRSSAFAYKGVPTRIGDIARDLGVQYVLEGSVRAVGANIRITAQLINAVTDNHLWAEKYDRDTTQIFDVQDEIARRIVASVAPEYLLAEMERSRRSPTPVFEAWDAFIRGYWHFQRFTETDNIEAQRWLRQAIEIDSQQAKYHSMLAVAYAIAVLYGWANAPADTLETASRHANRGLSLDMNDTLVLRAAGLVRFFSKDHEAARDYYRQAVEANPLEAENHALLGAALGVDGQYDAALRAFEAALRLSPKDFHVASWYNYLGVSAFIVGRYDQAVEWARKCVQANPDYPGGYSTLAASYGQLGRIDEAVAACRRLQQLLPKRTISQTAACLPYFKKPDDLARYLTGLRKAGLPE